MSPGPLEASDRSVLLEISSVTAPNFAHTCLVLPVMSTFTATLIRMIIKGGRQMIKALLSIAYEKVLRCSGFVVVGSEKLKG